MAIVGIDKRVGWFTVDLLWTGRGTAELSTKVVDVRRVVAGGVFGASRRSSDLGESVSDVQDIASEVAVYVDLTLDPLTSVKHGAVVLATQDPADGGEG